MPKLSILIPTLTDRKQDYLEPLRKRLDLQIKACGGDVEVLVDEDQGQMATGTKRNRLLQRACGLFSCFLDDDDEISDSYVHSILANVSPELDCLGFWGEVYFQGVFAARMFHSICCGGWYENNEGYYRPPNHLNPVRTDLSRQVKFPDVIYSEDYSWAMSMMARGLLKREIFMARGPFYIYKCREDKKGL